MNEWEQNETIEYDDVDVKMEIEETAEEEPEIITEPKPKKKHRFVMPLVSGIVSLLVTAATLTVFMLLSPPEHKNVMINYTANGSLAPVVGSDSGFLGLGERIAESVVLIPQQSSDNFFYQSMSVSGGTGVILSEDGYILTTCSAISGNSSVEVYLADGTSYDAELVGADQSYDCAVLKIEASNLKKVEFESSDSLESGMTVAAIGRILNDQLGTTLTLGTINGAPKSVRLTSGKTISLLQTSAATDNSTGSILVNSDGKVVAMVSSAYSSGVRNISLAIPSNNIMQIFESVTDTSVSSSGLVIGIKGNDSASGVVVESVNEDSPADKAGLQKDDLILKADGKQIKSVSELNKARDTHQKGDSMTLTVYRDGEVIDITITFD